MARRSPSGTLHLSTATMDPYSFPDPPDYWAIDAGDLTDDEINDRLADLADRDPRAYAHLLSVGLI